MPSPEIGRKLQAKRQELSLGVRALAREVGVSASMISQIERGTVMPSVATLYSIVQVLDISMDELFGAGSGGGRRRSTDGDGSPVHRPEDRPAILLDSGVRWELLTREGDDGFELMHSVYPPGSDSCPADSLIRHVGHEYGYVVSGRLGVTLGFSTHELEPGDSIDFDSTIPHRLFALGDEDVHLVWLVVGRSGERRDTP